MVVCGVKNHYLPKARIIKRVDSLFFLWLSCLPLNNNNNNKTWCLTSSETIRFIRDGEGGGGSRGEKRRGRLYTDRYTVTTRMTPALRWAAMRAILIDHEPTYIPPPMGGGGGGILPHGSFWVP